MQSVFWIINLSEYILCNHISPNDPDQTYSVLRCMKTIGTIVINSIFARLSTIFLAKSGCQTRHAYSRIAQIIE